MKPTTMAIHVDGRLKHIAERVADTFSAHGYAFVEDDRIEALAAVLQSFLATAQIPVNNPSGTEPRSPG